MKRNAEFQTTELERARAAWAQIRVHLKSKKDSIYEQIAHYPTPIAGCDQQFNYLLEEHRAISLEGARLNATENESLTAPDPLGVVDEFIRTSSYFDAQAKESLRL